MSGRLIILLGAIVLLVGACNESVEYSPYYVECDSESFSPICVTEISHAFCDNGRIVIRACEGDKTCMNGICQDNVTVDCRPESFVSTCADDNHKYICNAQNRIEKELCPVGTQCKVGSCIADDVCVEAEYISECVDRKHYTVCREHHIVTEACGDGGECKGGICVTDDLSVDEEFVSECMEVGKQCSNTEDDDNFCASRCNGGVYLYCNGDGYIVAKDCGGDSCHDGFGCYEPCDVVGESVYSCSENWAYDDEGNRDEFIDYTFIGDTCYEDPVYHIKHMEWDVNDACEYHCNDETGECL